MDTSAGVPKDWLDAALDEYEADRKAGRKRKIARAALKAKVREKLAGAANTDMSDYQNAGMVADALMAEPAQQED